MYIPTHDPTVGLSYMHPAHAASLVHHVAAAAADFAAYGYIRD